MNGFRSMCNVDGVVTRTEDARIPVMDRGFLYGDSVYEVFRTYDGVPLFYDEHWARFENSAALIQMNIGLSKAQMAAEIRQTVALTGAGAAGQDVYVRYLVTRGEGPIDLHPAPGVTTRYVIIVKEVPSWSPELYSRGLKMAIPDVRRNPSNALDPNIKGGNYLNNVLGVMEARALGADDCVMLDHAGFVTEASNSNVFFVIGGELVTPAQTVGNLRGLTKAAVHTACEQHGLESTERDIAAEKLPHAEECFLTSATREVMPVARLRLGDGRTLEFPAGGGPLTRRVAEYYKEYVRDHVERHRHLSLLA